MSVRLTTCVVLLAAFPYAAHAATYKVTTTADSGPGSLRSGFEAVNSLECASPCTIEFAIAAPVPPSGYFTIRPLSPLPALFGDAIVIDGSSQTRFSGDTNWQGPEIELDGSSAGYRSGIKLGRVVGMTLRGVAVNRFEGHGIFVDNSSNIEVDGCYVGIDPTGRHALPNGMDGIAVRSVYGGVKLRNNTISGNRGNGVYVAGLFDIEIAGNRIGLGNGDVALGNGANGIDIVAQVARIAGNRIENNAHYGVVVGDGGARVTLFANAIQSNGLMSIGLGHDALDPADPLDSDNGANGRVNSPVITSARADATLPGYYVGMVEYSGSVRLKPNTTVRIDAYAAPRRGPLGFAEATTLIGSDVLITDENGNASFTFPRSVVYTEEIILVPGGWLSATATTDEGTSELGPPQAISADYLDVTTLADAGAGSLREAITRANERDCSHQAPCWITFDLPASALRNGVAVLEPASPLPPITKAFVHIDGGSQTWRNGDTNPNGPEVEIRGTLAGAGPGLRVGSASATVAETFIHALAVTGFQGDGVSVDARAAGGYDGYDIRLNELVIGLDPATSSARGNSGNGISIRGARSGVWGMQWTVRNSTIGSNAGNGVRIDASGANLESSRIGVARDGSARANGGAGVFVRGNAHDVRVTRSTIAFNQRAGVSTGRDARAVYVASLLHSNGLLGIDRNDDGLGGGASDGVTPRPALHSVGYDPAINATVVEGEIGEGTPVLPPVDGSGQELQLNFYLSSSPDPSGFGEGAEYATGARAIRIVFTGRKFSAELPGDFRGRFLTATSSIANCLWEFGCHGRDTSEFSNALLVK